MQLKKNRARITMQLPMEAKADLKKEAEQKGMTLTSLIKLKIEQIKLILKE
jgi:hypothetical protein